MQDIGRVVRGQDDSAVRRLGGVRRVLRGVVHFPVLLRRVHGRPAEHRCLQADRSGPQDVPARRSQTGHDVVRHQHVDQLRQQDDRVSTPGRSLSIDNSLKRRGEGGGGEKGKKQIQLNFELNFRAIQLTTLERGQSSHAPIEIYFEIIRT